MTNDFPQYRRSANGNHIYRIDSETEFLELQYIGERAVLFRIVANTYMERLRIADLLAMKHGEMEVEAEYVEDLIRGLQTD